MYQLVIFDWDGTLMDSTLKIAHCIRAAATDMGLQPPSIADAKHIIGLGLYECMVILFPDADESIRLRLVDRYKYHFVSGDSTEQALFSGVQEGLQALESTGVLMAVATGKSRAGLKRAFSLTNIEHHFVVTRCADETRTKPHPQMLNEILDFTAIDANKAIMVGDTTYDLDMAVNAGVASLGVSYGAHPEKTLTNCGALSVQHSASQMIKWLMNGRIEKAYG